MTWHPETWRAKSYKALSLDHISHSLSRSEPGTNGQSPTTATHLNTWLWDQVAATLPSHSTQLWAHYVMEAHFPQLTERNTPLFHPLRCKLLQAMAEHVKTHSQRHTETCAGMWWSLWPLVRLEHMRLSCFCELLWQTGIQVHLTYIHYEGTNALQCWDSELDLFIYYFWTICRQHGCTVAEVTIVICWIDH